MQNEYNCGQSQGLEIHQSTLPYLHIFNFRTFHCECMVEGLCVQLLNAKSSAFVHTLCKNILISSNGQYCSPTVDMCVSSSFVVDWFLCSCVLAVATQVGSQPRSGIATEEGEDTSRTSGEGETEGQ